MSSYLKKIVFIVAVVISLNVHGYNIEDILNRAAHTIISTDLVANAASIFSIDSTSHEMVNSLAKTRTSIDSINIGMLTLYLYWAEFNIPKAIWGEIMLAVGSHLLTMFQNHKIATYSKQIAAQNKRDANKNINNIKFLQATWLIINSLVAKYSDRADDNSRTSIAGLLAVCSEVIRRYYMYKLINPINNVNAQILNAN